VVAACGTPLPISLNIVLTVVVGLVAFHALLFNEHWTASPLRGQI
jgi:hypothetical protein